jgi:hypothetical protein
MVKNPRKTNHPASPQKNLRQALRGENHHLKAQPQQPLAPTVKASYHRAGRWLDKPKPEHEIVLRALEIANRALRRTVSVDEILKALMPKEINVLQATYPKDLSSTVSVILKLLCRRGCAFSPGKLGTRRFYGIANVLGTAISLPLMQESRRQRVLRLVRHAVQKLGRAVRIGDILEYAASSPEAGDISPNDITHDVLSLKEEGELHRVGSIRGDEKGYNLYLPADLNLDDYMPPNSLPLTWLQTVSLTFEELWAERAGAATNESIKPRPLSTGEVRERLRASMQHAENLADPMILVNAMQQLAETKKPVLRKIRRPGHRMILWAPIEVPDEELDLRDAYASDIERVCEAVHRAENELKRPVKFHEIQDQTDLDPSLQPSGASSLFSVLADAAKENIGESDGKRRKRVTQHVYRIGKIADTSYYSASRSPEAQAFVEYGQLKLRWESMRVEEQLTAIEMCSLPCVAIGRARLIATELALIVHDLNRIRESKHLHGESWHEANEFHRQMVEIADATSGWLNRNAPNDSYLPLEVDTNVPGLTANELLEMVKPFYPTSQKLKKGANLISLIGDAIRRVTNREYVNRFNKDQRLASKYLFDRTDALIYIAKEWGGYECCLQATLAANELGWLRDPRFILPALEAPDFNARLSAVASLAFLSSELGNERLRVLAINDPDSGVRQSALWAYGFAGGSNAQELLVNCSKEDKDSRVRTFAQNVLNVSQDSWWVL